MDDEKYIGIVKAQVQSDFKHHPFDWPYQIYMKYDERVFRLTMIMKDNTILQVEEVPEDQMEMLLSD